MIWEKIVNECRIKHTTPTAMTKELKISSSSVTAWKNGSYPDTKTVIKIAEYFSCTTDYLLGRTEERNFRSELDERESMLIEAFRKCNEKGKAKITQVTLNEVERTERERAATDSCCTG